jgi:hypothetical protein
MRGRSASCKAQVGRREELMVKEVPVVTFGSFFEQMAGHHEQCCQLLDSVKPDCGNGGFQV